MVSLPTQHVFDVHRTVSVGVLHLFAMSLKGYRRFETGFPVECGARRFFAACPCRRLNFEAATGAKSHYSLTGG
jgi:hypothetical protein